MSAATVWCGGLAIARVGAGSNGDASEMHEGPVRQNALRCRTPAGSSGVWCGIDAHARKSERRRRALALAELGEAVEFWGVL